MKLDTLKAMGWTALATGGFAFIATATGWATEAQDAIRAGESIPDPSVLGSAAISALLAAGSAFGTALLAWGRGKSWFPGQPPSYERETVT